MRRGLSSGGQTGGLSAVFGHLQRKGEHIVTDSIIFDLDGTLWDSSEAVAATWDRVFRAHGLPGVTTEDIRGIMGLTMDRIAARMMPHEPEARRAAILQECCKAENELLRRQGAKLYDGVKETLAALMDRYRLFIVSNCQQGYIEAFLEGHRLSRWFKDYESFGRTGLGKAENIALVVRRNGLRAPVYVGDTPWDAVAAEDAGVPFLHARYGFGQVPDAVWHVDSFRDLPGVVAQVRA